MREEDEPALLQLVDARGGELAAVLLSLPYNRCVSREFLLRLRERCRVKGVLLAPRKGGSAAGTCCPTPDGAAGTVGSAVPVRPVLRYLTSSDGTNTTLRRQVPSLLASSG